MKIKTMTRHTNLKNGYTFYHVYYKKGYTKTLHINDNWSTEMVLFFTSDKTKVVENKIIDNYHYERFEYVD